MTQKSIGQKFCAEKKNYLFSICYFNMLNLGLDVGFLFLIDFLYYCAGDLGILEIYFYLLIFLIFNIDHILMSWIIS